MVCEASSGYVGNLKIYTGKENGETQRLVSTVGQLLQPWENAGYHVYMDNYYNNVSTAEHLLSKGIRVCGTIRANRGLPANLRTVIPKGENRFSRKGDILIHI